jgi:spore germination protein KC
MFRVIIIMCILIIPLSGCWDKYELEELAYVVVIGIDKGEDEQMFNVTFQISNPQVGSTQKSPTQTEKASQIVTIPATDIVTAKDTANALITRKVTFSHADTLIFGEEFARTKEFEKILSTALRDKEIRSTMNIIITKEKAETFIKNNKPTLETRPHKFFEFMQRRWKHTGLVPYSTINRYFQRMDGYKTIFLAIYATSFKNEEKMGYEDDYLPGEIGVKGGDPIQFIGAAVMKDGKMIDTITGEENRICLLLRSETKADQWLATYPDPLKEGYRISARLFRNKDTKIKINTDEEYPKINVTVPLTIQLVSVRSQINYVTDEQKQKQLVKSIQDNLEKKTMEFVKMTQKEYKDDPFKWSLEAKKNFLTFDDFFAYKWKEKYPQAEVNVKYDIVLEDFGKQLKPPFSRGDETFE